ncbi:CP [Blackcurrant leafroll-associated virus 1]|uniref:CP n=1 Tax=Blackcurrant leafroll-associated virus 1 TaxID=2292426 RepID=UPI000EB7442B|nr:CP [Blackcurrant leafroll-associated virus 1]AYA58351.1 CP [Blackcurrant leafroll-associated virus 1]
MANDGEKLKGFNAANILNGLDVDSIEQYSTEVFNTSENTEINNKVFAKIKELNHANDADKAAHILAVLTRLATRSTSRKVRDDGKGYIRYPINGVKYEIKDSDIFPYMLQLPLIASVPNGLRKWGATNEAGVVFVAMKKPKLFESRRSTRAGTPMSKGYLSTDFLTGSLPEYSELDRATMRRSQEVNLDRVTTDLSGSLISLSDLGNQRCR